MYIKMYMLAKFVMAPNRRIYTGVCSPVLLGKAASDVVGFAS